MVIAYMAARIASKPRSKMATPALDSSPQRGISTASGNCCRQASVRRRKQRCAGTKGPTARTLRVPLTELLRGGDVVRTLLLLLLLALTAASAAPLRSSTPTTSATPASASTAATSATSATTTTLQGRGVVEALTMCVAGAPPRKPGTWMQEA
ncbi:unnamed protein product [Closterium sp. NIES-54]